MTTPLSPLAQNLAHLFQLADNLDKEMQKTENDCTHVFISTNIFTNSISFEHKPEGSALTKFFARLGRIFNPRSYSIEKSCTRLETLLKPIEEAKPDEIQKTITLLNSKGINGDLKTLTTFKDRLKRLLTHAVKSETRVNQVMEKFKNLPSAKLATLPVSEISTSAARPGSEARGSTQPIMQPDAPGVKRTAKDTPPLPPLRTDLLSKEQQAKVSPPQLPPTPPPRANLPPATSQTAVTTTDSAPPTANAGAPPPPPPGATRASPVPGPTTFPEGPSQQTTSSLNPTNRVGPPPPPAAIFDRKAVLENFRNALRAELKKLETSENDKLNLANERINQEISELQKAWQQGLNKNKLSPEANQNRSKLEALKKSLQPSFQEKLNQQSEVERKTALRETIVRISLLQKPPTIANEAWTTQINKAIDEDAEPANPYAKAMFNVFGEVFRNPKNFFEPKQATAVSAKPATPADEENAKKVEEANKRKAEALEKQKAEVFQWLKAEGKDEETIKDTILKMTDHQIALKHKLMQRNKK